MKNILFLVVAAMLVSSCQYKNKESVTPPITPVVEETSRLEMNDMSVIPLRTKTVTGEMTVIDSDFIDIAKINSPKFNNSFGDVQATAVEVKDNKAYIVYNVSGNEVGGAIDIVDISIPSEPRILNTYTSEQYEFSDVVVRDNILYVSGYQKDVGAVLMILSIENDRLDIVKIMKIKGTYSTDLSLYGNVLSVITGESGGVTELDISNTSSPVEISYNELSNGLSVSANSYFSFYVKGSSDTSISARTRDEFNKIFNLTLTSLPLYSKTVAAQKSEAPTRIKLKNSILYSLNAKSKKFELLDASQSGKISLLSPLKTIGELSVIGTPNGFDMDQQIVFLALGEEGVQIADIKNVSLPVNSGTLLFRGDNGSANNIWVKETINDQKYVFIAHGRQGVRIITKKKSVGSDNKVVVSARGDKQLLENAKYQIRINGTVVHTQEVGDEFTQYTYTHTRNLISSDKVEIVFINDNQGSTPNLKRNLFVNYLWAVDKFCYQKQTNYKETLNDFGFFESGDSLVYNKGTCETIQKNTPKCTSSQHIEDNVCVDNEKVCNILNGTGIQTWHSECGWSLCTPNTCSNGFLLINGVCTPKVCTAGETKTCSVLNGTGTQSCLSTELGFGACTPTVCNQNHILQNGICVPQICTPNGTNSCSILNGTGTQKCSADGLSLGTCQVSSCLAGFKKEGNTCVLDPNYCVNGTTKPCSCDNGTGTLSCSNNQWSTTCTPTSCSSGFVLQNGLCIPQLCSPNSTASCSITNGTGTKTCNSTGLAYGSCTPTSCNSGFVLQNGTCVPQVCTPNSTASCSVTNGTGTKTCNSTGLAYGTCTTNSCNSGFVLQNGACVPQVCTPNSTTSCTINNFIGVKTCSANGLELSSCTPTGTCVQGYSLQNGMCVPQLCTPNSTASCSVDNGTGIKSCNATGLAYGSCVLNSCNSGYVLDGGVCKPKICTPYETKSCAKNNGAGIQVCDSKGLNFSECQITSCDSGYDKKFTASQNYSFCSNEYEDCVVNADNVTIKYGKNGVYTQESIINQQVACSNSVFGDPLFGTVKECLVKGTFSCELRVCKSNEYDNGSKCVPKVCTPNEVTSCTVNNFIGTQTCNSNGSSLGTCTPTGVCANGFSLQNGMCVPQICTPNATASCSISNGVGSKTCSSNGLSWGYCNPLSCHAGYYPQFVTSNIELVSNGNFSQSSSLIGSSNQQILSTLLTKPYGTWDIYNSLPSWTLVEGSGIEIWSDGSGSGFIELDGNENYKTSQAFSLDNTQYVLRADYKPRTETSNDNKVSLYLTGASSVFNQQLLTMNETSSTQSGWKKSTSLFTPNSGSYSLLIQGEGLNTSYGGFIDNVSLQKVTGNGSCVALTCTPNAVKSCLINNFIGTQTCNSSGSEWGSCVSSGSCKDGFSLQNGMCVPQICQPHSQTSCAVNNGSGVKTCSSDGLSYGSCTTVSCSSGYVLQGGSCVPQVCTPNSTLSCSINNFVGVKTCNSTGTVLSSCVSTGSCISGYVLDAGVCKPQVCSPNSTASCSVTNGTGTKTCNSTGLSYGSCTTNSCNSGFVLQNGSCVAQLCSPNSTTSCSVSNGTGIKTCSSNGMSYGSCTVSSCHPGYKLSNNTCVVDTNYCSTNGSTRSCSCENGGGVQTCSNNQWSSTCTPKTCNSGYTLKDGKCVAQICTPKATAFCSISNGIGYKTCSLDGLSYGSCTAKSCNYGYILDQGKCVKPVCHH